MVQVALFFIGTTLWCETFEEIKITTNLKTFENNLKKHYLKKIVKSNL